MGQSHLPLLSHLGKLKLKEGFTILKISKSEATYLMNNNVKFGYGGIRHTTARHRRNYYMTESVRNLQLLNNYRKLASN